MVERSVKARALGCSAHYADLDRNGGRKIALAHRGKIFAVERAQCFDGIFFANGAPPDRRGAGQIWHGGPIGKVSRENYAGVALAIEKFGATLHPIIGIKADHDPRLVIERGVFAIHSGLEHKIASGGQVKEVPVVSDIAVESFAPEVRLGAAANGELIARNLCRSWFVQPGHAAEQNARTGCALCKARQKVLRADRECGRSQQGTLQEYSPGELHGGTLEMGQSESGILLENAVRTPPICGN